MWCRTLRARARIGPLRRARRGARLARRVGEGMASLLRTGTTPPAGTHRRSNAGVIIARALRCPALGVLLALPALFAIIPSAAAAQTDVPRLSPENGPHPQRSLAQNNVSSQDTARPRSSRLFGLDVAWPRLEPHALTSRPIRATWRARSLRLASKSEASRASRRSTSPAPQHRRAIASRSPAARRDASGPQCGGHPCAGAKASATVHHLLGLVFSAPPGAEITVEPGLPPGAQVIAATLGDEELLITLYSGPRPPRPAKALRVHARAIEARLGQAGPSVHPKHRDANFSRGDFRIPWLGHTWAGKVIGFERAERPWRTWVIAARARRGKARVTIVAAWTRPQDLARPFSRRLVERLKFAKREALRSP